MFNAILETVFNSFLELLSIGIKAIPAILSALVIVFLTRYFAQFVERLITKLVKRTVKSTSLQVLFIKTSGIGVWVVGVLVACVIVFPDFSLGDVIATLGISSIAIGFAFQDIFKNFLAGILLLLQEPFRIGDEIIIENYEGIVESIDIRTTQIRTYEGERVLLPNSTVFTNPVKVKTAYDYRRTDLAVGVDYNTSLAKASLVLEETIAEVDGVLSQPSPEIDLVSFGDSSIDFIVRYWRRSQQQEFRHVQTRAIIAIKKAFDRANINIPYPIRTVYYYDQQKFNDYLPSSLSNLSY